MKADDRSVIVTVEAHGNKIKMRVPDEITADLFVKDIVIPMMVSLSYHPQLVYSSLVSVGEEMQL